MVSDEVRCGTCDYGILSCCRGTGMISLVLPSD